MNEKPTFQPFLISTLLLLLGGWGGLMLLFTYTKPYLWPRWGFFALVVFAFTGAAVPVSYLLNRIFPSNPVASAQVIVRQALWVGAYGGIMAWLQVGRILNFSLGLWLALGMTAIEYIIRMRETTAKPPKNVTPQPPLS